MPRRLVVPAALAVLAVALFLAAMTGDHSSGDLRVEVLSASDPFGVDAITALRVEVENRSQQVVRPRFSVQWSSYPLYWRIVEGPGELAARASATYDLEAPAGPAAPAVGTAFQVRVNDADSILYTVSSPVPNQKTSTPDLINPGFALWGKQYNKGSVVNQPFGWQIYRRIGAGDSAAISQAEIDGKSAVSLELEQDGSGAEAEWAQTGLLQRIPFPEAPLDVIVQSATTYEATDSGWPLRAFGLELSDDQDHIVWVIFQPGDRPDLAYDLTNGQHIIVMSLAETGWATRNIDLGAIYRELDWEAGPTVLLNLFVAAATTSPGRASGYVSEVKTHTGDFGYRPRSSTSQ